MTEINNRSGIDHTPPPPDFTAAWWRAVAHFPLNGDLAASGGCTIWLLEVQAGVVLSDVYRRYAVTSDASSDAHTFDDIGKAVKFCLSNNGWGTFKIEDVTHR